MSTVGKGSALTDGSIYELSESLIEGTKKKKNFCDRKMPNREPPIVNQQLANIPLSLVWSRTNSSKHIKTFNL